MSGSLVNRNSYHPIYFKIVERFLTGEDVQDLKNLKHHHDEGVLDETEFKASKAAVLEAAKRRRPSPVEPQPGPAHQRAATAPAPTIVPATESTAPPSTAGTASAYCDIAFGGRPPPSRKHIPGGVYPPR